MCASFSCSTAIRIDSQCSLVFHQRFCWLVQNIDSSGKYYSLCSCLIAFICLFSVFYGSDECLHFAETRQVRSQNRAQCILYLCAFILFILFDAHCNNISLHTKQHISKWMTEKWKKRKKKTHTHVKRRDETVDVCVHIRQTNYVFLICYCFWQKIFLNG